MQRLTFCIRYGHAKTERNVYRWTDKRGYVHEECKPCRRIRQRERRKNVREAKE